jgi:steroid delta-isomerase-like uncharacterized protein
MSNENKATLQRFFDELFTQGDLNVADELVAANYLNHNAVPGETPGREGLKQFVAYLHRAWADLNFAVEDQIAEGDKVTTRFTITGTHQGEFAGVPATGKPIRIQAINIHRVTDGQIQEAWVEWDAMGMMQQLGVMPESV